MNCHSKWATWFGLIALVVFTIAMIWFLNAIFHKPSDRYTAESLHNKSEHNMAGNAIQQSYGSVSLPAFESCSKLTKGLNCRALFSNQPPADILSNAKSWQLPENEVFAEDDVITLSASCSKLITTLELIMSPMTKAEADFSLAYTWLIYKNIHQFLMILRRIYRPQHLFCVHVDTKSPPQFKQAIALLTKCLPNMLLPERNFDVGKAGERSFKGNYACMERMHNTEHPWKYVQTLTGTDFPLRTNAEMVQMFHVFNGSADGTTLGPWIGRVAPAKTIPPGGLIVFGGNTGVALSREFIRFVFTNPVALDLYKWAVPTHAPEEMFFSTLIHNVHLNPPGGYPGYCLQYFQDTQYYPKRPPKPFMARYQAWPHMPCEGKQGQHSCIYGVGDLPLLVRKPHLIAHKFETDFEPAALYCLDELICNRTLDPTNQHHEKYDFGFDVEYYKSLPSVVYHNMQDKSKYVCPGFDEVCARTCPKDKQ